MKPGCKDTPAMQTRAEYRQPDLRHSCRFGTHLCRLDCPRRPSVTGMRTSAKLGHVLTIYVLVARQFPSLGKVDLLRLRRDVIPDGLDQLVGVAAHTVQRYIEAQAQALVAHDHQAA